MTEQPNQNQSDKSNNMTENPLTKNHLLIVALAATVALLALAVLRPSTLTPTAPSSDLEALAKGEMAAFKWSASRSNLAPFKFRNTSGDEITLEKFKGKVVLLNLWATWCAPCLEEMPTLDRLQKELGGMDFTVIALALDTKGAKAAQQILDKLNIKNLGLYIDPTTKATRPLNIKGMPTTILFDKVGREVGRLEGPAAWDSAQAKKLVRAVVEKSKVN